MKMVEEEKAKYPPGTRLMPDQERLETLKDLIDSKRELNTALEKLPVVSKTIQMTRHKKDYEEKINRIDKAIDTFSKKQVYVAF
jgi:ABC-type Fe3+-citrate transport system substrate-binding protein